MSNPFDRVVCGDFSGKFKNILNVLRFCFDIHNLYCQQTIKINCFLSKLQKRKKKKSKNFSSSINFSWLKKVKRKEEMRTFVHSFLMTVDYRRSKKNLIL
jgi:ABC-type polar amino acid transport system ATPase subunit